MFCVGRRGPGFGRTWLVQISAAFTNRLAPAGLGGMQTNVRYLEGAGATRQAAMASVALGSIAGLMVHVLGLALILPLLGAGKAHLRLSGPDLPDSWPFLVGAVGLLAVAGVVRWRVRLGRHLRPSMQAAQTAVAGVVTRPRRALLLFGGSAGVTAAYALALVTAGRAVSLGLPPTTVVAVYLAGSAVAAAAPTPGGLGAMEVALVAGLTSAGAATTPAVATVLAYRLITYWLPLVPGMAIFFAFRGNKVQQAFAVQTPRPYDAPAIGGGATVARSAAGDRRELRGRGRPRGSCPGRG
jgi:undecaprenyl-diphosphatase